MSISGLNWAWDAPVTKSTQRLILVALGDISNESLQAFPSWAYLKKKTCLSRNTIAKCLNVLIELGAIEDTGNRKGRTNSVIVYQLKQYQNWYSTNIETSTNIEHEAVPNLSRSSTKIGIQTPQEPSLEQKEGMSIPVSKKSKCPYEEILALYHKKLSALPKQLQWTDKRKSQIRKLWIGDDLTALEYWGNFFDHVDRSDFLMGRTTPVNGHRHFRANLEWITNPANYVKIYEDFYHE